MSLNLHPDRLFPADTRTRDVARQIHAGIEHLPIISPHGHTDPAWFAYDQPFADPAALLITPDHYLLRMLYSQGVPLETLGVAPLDGGWVETDARLIWRRFAEHYPLFRGTPSRMWMDWVLSEVFGIAERLTPQTADASFDQISHALAQPDLRPRALFERFNIEVLATTESPLDPLTHHAAIRTSGWQGRVVTAFRPDPVLDPDTPGFAANLQTLGEMTGEDTATYPGYLRALESRRSAFRAAGATSTDHGHPTAATAELSFEEADRLFGRVAHGRADAADAELFRAHMLVEMARMSVEDGMVMQIHPGAYRNHNPALFARFGRDKGADIPVAVEFVRALKPLLDRFGSDPRLRLIVFTLDETTYARELAPLAGHYPALKLGPAWWFNDSPQGMRRFREQTTETAGFYNTVGFNDDTRAFLSIPARHDMARRVDSGVLARLVVEHRLPLDEAHEVAHALTYGLVKTAYKL